jgi:hypothetical protein
VINVYPIIWGIKPFLIVFRKSKCDCQCLHFDTIVASMRAVLHFFDNNELSGETTLFEKPSSPNGKTQSNLAALFVTPIPKKNNEDGNQFINDEPFIDERKPSSTTVEKGNFNNGEHTLIPVTAKMIHSTVFECKRLVLKDG